MDYAVSIKLTEKQYHLIKEMAKDQYRTIGNTLAMFVVEGFKWYVQDHEVYIKRMECDRISTGGDYQFYTDEESIETLDQMPLTQ